MHTSDIELTPYREWSPTQFDTKGLDLKDRHDWLVAPCGTNRDADIITRANWEAQLEDLRGAEGITEDDEPKDFEVHRFGHWGPGWFEIVLVRPDSEAHRRCQAMAASLSDYPLLSDDIHSDMQVTEESECWENYAATEFLRELAAHHDRDVDEFESVTHDQAFSHWHAASQDEGWSTEWSHEGPTFNFCTDVLDRVDCDALIRGEEP